MFFGPLVVQRRSRDSSVSTVTRYPVLADVSWGIARKHRVPISDILPTLFYVYV